MDQPDISEPCTREENIRQPRPILTAQNKIFQSQNPASTQSYQPTQMQIEIPLPYYLCCSANIKQEIQMHIDLNKREYKCI